MPATLLPGLRADNACLCLQERWFPPKPWTTRTEQWPTQSRRCDVAYRVFDPVNSRSRLNQRHGVVSALDPVNEVVCPRRARNRVADPLDYWGIRAVRRYAAFREARAQVKPTKQPAVQRLFFHLQRQGTLTRLGVDEYVVVLGSSDFESGIVEAEALAPVLLKKARHVDDLPHDDRTARLR